MHHIDILDHSISSILQQQIAYYKARASEYDEWFLRQGRYDRGPEFNGKWFREVEIIRSALQEFNPAGSILELACGTGLWTQELLKYSNKITAVDASSEVLSLNSARQGTSTVQYVEADIFNWKPQDKYDVVFFSFWLSHVPQELFFPFWKMVCSAMKPTGRFFFIDSKHEPSSTAKDHTLGKPDADIADRRLNDGREYKIVKIFHQKAPLIKRLQELGISADIDETQNYFIYGSGNLKQ